MSFVLGPNDKLNPVMDPEPIKLDYVQAIGNLENSIEFKTVLAEQYRELFANDDPRYSPTTKKTSPDLLAIWMTNGLLNKRAAIDGEGIKRTCKKLGIKYTKKGVYEYLGV